MSWIERRIVECTFIAPSVLVILPLSLSNCKYITSVSVMMLFAMLLLDIWNYGMKIISILISGYKHTRVWNLFYIEELILKILLFLGLCSQLWNICIGRKRMATVERAICPSIVLDYEVNFWIFRIIQYLFR